MPGSLQEVNINDPTAITESDKYIIHTDGCKNSIIKIIFKVKQLISKIMNKINAGLFLSVGLNGCLIL